MSTDLYGIRILETDREARRVRMRVFVVYYDVSYESHQPIPTDRSFFVRVLCDKEALGDDISWDDRFDEAFIDANAFRYVDRFVELERRNEPVTDWESFSDFYYERGGGWVDEDKLVQADYDVFVSKPEYVDAMVVGDSWGTTSYETNADELTADDYLLIPDFGDVRRFVPFPDGDQETSAARKLLFSPDGTQLLVSTDAGGFGVFDVAETDCVLSVPKAGDWTFDPGWTPDGRVTGVVDGEFVAWDVGTSSTEPFGPFGVASSSDGQRFARLTPEGGLQLVTADGEVLWERTESAEDLVISIGWDAAGASCVLGVETETLKHIDLQTGEVTDLGTTRFMGVALSPDGSYAMAATFDGLLVLRIADGEVIRRWRAPAGYITGVAWSPTGQLVAATVTDEQGYHSAVHLHRTGAAVLAAEAAPQEVPSAAPGDLRDVVRLYLEQTAGFSGGWSSHLDDDKHDMHLALARLGLDLDLVPTISAPPMQIAARAYEASIRHHRGDSAGARAALDDALARVEAADIEPWAMTFVHAPVAAAQHVLGELVPAEQSLALAHVDLDDESNDFQKRAVLCRALIAMGRLDAVEAVVGEADADWIGDFHLRLVTDLVDAGEWDLLKLTWETWSCGDEWDATELLEQRLREVGELERAGDFDLDIDEDEDDDGTSDDEPSDDDDRVGWLGRQGRWDEAYALIDGTKKTKRNPLWHAVIEAAQARGDLSVLLDALSKLPCGDMNAPGLRALQDAVKTMAGVAYRPYHP